MNEIKLFFKDIANEYLTQGCGILKAVKWLTYSVIGLIAISAIAITVSVFI
jgi:hypothetical protein